MHFKVVFPALQAAPPVLLYAYDYEPIARERLHEAWSDLTAADHYNPLRADMQLLPFAETGAGDVYCFWTNAPGFAEPPVLLVWHDDDRADLLATVAQLDKTTSEATMTTTRMHGDKAERTD